MKYYDIHTHKKAEHPDVTPIVNHVVKEGESGKAREPGYLSCGIHPWYITDKKKQISLLRQLAAEENVVAIGEAGLDKLAQTPMESQIPVFKEQVLLSESLVKPLIIHCVKAWDELLVLRKEYMPGQAWIVHGFRGNGMLAEQLIRHGLLLSFGKKFNPDALIKAWPDRLFAETDEQESGIQETYGRIAESLSVSGELLSAQISENVNKIFCLH